MNKKESMLLAALEESNGMLGNLMTNCKVCVECEDCFRFPCPLCMLLEKNDEIIAKAKVE